MLSEPELQELLAQKTETRNFDCKASFNWDDADNDAKCELVKDILALMNTQDGGRIAIGVRDGDLEAVGMSDADFVSFDTTKVNEFVHRYTDPQCSCEVQKLTLKELKFVVISVLEFKDIPIICKKAANSSKDSSKTILKLGGVYVRTEKATSVLIPTSEEMRDLLNRAMLKRGDQLLSQIRTLLTRNLPSKEEDIKQYDHELLAARKYFEQSMPLDSEKRGYWEVISMPLIYNKERISSIARVAKALADSEVRIRGWNFPYLNKDTNTNFSYGRQSHTEFMNHIEAHRAYQSGLFIWRGLYWEHSPHFKRQHEKALSFVNVIYTVTEFLLFLKRYYERVSPDSFISIRFSIRMTDIEGRTLEATEWDVTALPENYTATEPDLTIEKEYSVPELRATAEEIAVSIVQRIFEVFNWNGADPDMIRSWQQQLLQMKR